MKRIHKLPFLFGGFMAVLVGITSYVCGSEDRTTYFRMAVAMVIFYIIGLFVRNTLLSIDKEVMDKKEKESNELLHKQLQQNEHKINLVADDSSEEFSPLAVSKVISSKIKE